MALRTVPVEQPRLRAIWGRKPLLASRRSAPANGEGLAGSESRLGLLSLGGRKTANKERWFHTHYSGQLTLKQDLV